MDHDGIPTDFMDHNGPSTGAAASTPSFHFVQSTSNTIQGVRSPGGSPNRNIQRRARILCPVEGCPESLTSSNRRFRDFLSIRNHLNDHCTGHLSGALPVDFLGHFDYSQCRLCDKILHKRYNETWNKPHMVKILWRRIIKSVGAMAREIIFLKFILPSMVNVPRYSIKSDQIFFYQCFLLFTPHIVEKFWEDWMKSIGAMVFIVFFLEFAAKYGKCTKV